jgi:uncharacterized membrane protein YqjE
VESVRYFQDENTRTTANIVARILDTGQKLVSQEIRLAKAEVSSEYANLKRVAAMYVGLAVAGTFALVLGTLSLIDLLTSFGLEAWAVYGVLALLYVTAGVGLFFASQKVGDTGQETVNSTLKGE